MVKLRRHDWRSHREIKCNICDENLQSRDKISVHRQTKHQMFSRVKCKFYPECIDGDECFFEHNVGSDAPETDGRSYFCPNGENCNDQSCGSKHMKTSRILSNLYLDELDIFDNNICLKALARLLRL